MKVLHMDPRVPLVLKPEHEATIDRQVAEAVAAIDEEVFVMEALEIDAFVNGKVAEINTQMEAESKGTIVGANVRVVNHDRIDSLAKEKAVFEAMRRTPAQLVEKKLAAIKAEAIAVLTKFHDKQMNRRLAHWHMACRMDGCDKQPRKGLRQVQHKSRKRSFVFCKEHAGVRNMIPKSDYQRLKSDSNLRVVNA